MMSQKLLNWMKRGRTKVRIILLIIFTIFFSGNTYAIEDTNEKLTISIVGDMSFASTVESVIKRNGADYIFMPYSKYFLNSDIVLGNLETAVSTRGMAMKDKQYTFKSNPSIVNYLKKYNITALSIANNHILDFGRDAFLDTMKHLKDKEIGYAGGGINQAQALTPLIIEKKGKKIGFLAFSKVIPTVDWYSTTKRSGVVGAYRGHEKSVVNAVKSAKEKCDILIVSVHWGRERENKFGKDEQYMAHKIIDAGADVIMGHHPHVVQGIEMYKEKPIFYSLGNFIFTKSSLSLCNKVMLARISFSNDKKLTQIELVPGIINEPGRPVPMNEKDRVEFFKYLDTLNVNYKINNM